MISIYNFQVEYLTLLKNLPYYRQFKPQLFFKSCINIGYRQQKIIKKYHRYEKISEKIDAFKKFFKAF